MTVTGPSRWISDNRALEEVLRSLASYVGAGGYNAPTVDPDVFEDKIRWGIDHLINATIQRCADVVEEQSRSYGRSTWGSCKRAVLDLKSPDAAKEMQDWRIGQMHVELEHLVVSPKGGELYCGLCKSLVGEDGTLHPPSCPLSYGYDHVRRMLSASVDTRPQGGDAAETAAPFTSGAVPPTAGDAHPSSSTQDSPHA